VSDDRNDIKYLVTDAKGEFVIEIPATWKVTFGAVNPGSGGGGRHDLHCLRVYEGQKLRGVFCDVRGIRDLSIPLARKVEKQTGSSKWERDSMGNFKEERQVDVQFSLERGEPDWPME
jgi:hypothetical protein